MPDAGLIAYSLWGAAPKYCVGAIRNAELALRIYPGWRCRFYCATSVPDEVIARLAAWPHVEIVRREHPITWKGLFWRFEAAADPAADAIIIRDADSRLNSRERAAVDEWLASGARGHAMRDHPWHVIDMLGGMWGVRNGVLPDILDLLAPSYTLEHAPWGSDQRFLAEVVLPRLGDSIIVHDEYYGGRPFPTPRRWREYVGQPFDEHDRPLIPGPTAFGRKLRQAVRRLIPR